MRSRLRSPTRALRWLEPIVLPRCRTDRRPRKEQMVRGLALLFLVAVAVPAAAQAKEPIKIGVCGESACSAASNPIVGHDPFGGSGVEPTDAAPPGPYYRLDL